MTTQAAGPPTTDTRRGVSFRYLGFEVDPAAGRLTCRYRLDYGAVSRDFREVIVLPGGGDWSCPAAVRAARLVFLLAGISYYKTGAPPLIDLGEHALTETEHAFLTAYYLDGLGEFAHRGGLDLSDLRIVAPRRAPDVAAGYRAVPGRPLVPFGGGVDSIVSVELLRPAVDGAALFVVNRPGDTFAAIEDPAAVTGWPIVRAERSLDEQVLRSRELGFLNGHVPVTGIISAIAVLAAVLAGRDAVVMSNEWSALSATLLVDGREVNHQWSKSVAFETGLRAVLDEALGEGLQYFSLLRPFTELWIAERFAELPQYFSTFRSCNRAFHLDPAARWDHWCGSCDKCAFIDLILAPFVPAPELAAVFAREGEPLTKPALHEAFRRLLALGPDAKPWECVGDEAESRVAARLAAARPDRAGNALLARLVAEAAGHADPPPDDLLRPVGLHFVPDRYAPDALLG